MVVAQGISIVDVTQVTKFVTKTTTWDSNPISNNVTCKARYNADASAGCELPQATCVSSVRRAASKLPKEEIRRLPGGSRLRAKQKFRAFGIIKRRPTHETTGGNSSRKDAALLFSSKKLETSRSMEGMARLEPLSHVDRRLDERWPPK